MCFVCLLACLLIACDFVLIGYRFPSHQGRIAIMCCMRTSTLPNDDCGVDLRLSTSGGLLVLEVTPMPASNAVLNAIVPAMILEEDSDNFDADDS